MRADGRSFVGKGTDSMRLFFRRGSAVSAQDGAARAAALAAGRSPAGGFVRRAVEPARARAPRATMTRLVSVGALVAAGLVAVGVGPAPANVMRSPSHGGKLVSLADSGGAP